MLLVSNRVHKSLFLTIWLKVLKIKFELQKICLFLLKIISFQALSLPRLGAIYAIH